MVIDRSDDREIIDGLENTIVSDHTKDERFKADAAYEKVQRDARAREREREKQAEELKARDDNTTRLKALRLEREGAERAPFLKLAESTPRPT